MKYIFYLKSIKARKKQIIKEKQIRIKKGGENMKFIKGMILGGMIAAGVMMMYENNMNTKKIMKKGKQMARKMGIM